MARLPDVVSLHERTVQEAAQLALVEPPPPRRTRTGPPQRFGTAEKVWPLLEQTALRLAGGDTSRIRYTSARTAIVR